MLPFKRIQFKYPLNLNLTLLCGQVFRFKKIQEKNIFEMFSTHDDIKRDKIFEINNLNLKDSKDSINKILKKESITNNNVSNCENNELFLGNINQHFYCLKQFSNYEIGYISISNDLNKSKINDEELITNFFTLNKDIQFIHDSLSLQCPFYAKIFPYYNGLQMIDQSNQIFECIIAFITSSNNNVKRIMLLMDKLSQKYGEKVENDYNLQLYRFPTYNCLKSNATEKELRNLGFGYRAKYIIDSLQVISDEGGIEKFIEKCNNISSSLDLINYLMKLPGAGRKVSSCIALYAFQRLEIVPIDVHILNQFHFCLYYKHLPKSEENLIKKLDSLSLKSKVSISDKQMNQIMKVFEQLFQKNAGHLQLYLYASLVGENKHLLPQSVYNELLDIRSELISDFKPNKRRKLI